MFFKTDGVSDLAKQFCNIAPALPRQVSILLRRKQTLTKKCQFSIFLLTMTLLKCFLAFARKL